MSVQPIPTWLFWLSLNITISNLMSYGWITFPLCLSLNGLLLWIQGCVPLFMYFMHSQGVTLLRHSGRGKKTAWDTWHLHPKPRAHLKTSCSCMIGSLTKPCQPYRFTRCLSMTEHGTSQRSMIVENNCSRESPEYWIIYHLRRQHYSSI